MTELYPEAPFEDVDPDAPPIPDMSIRSDDEKTIAAEVGFSFITAVLMGKALGIWPKLGERFSSGYDHQTLWDWVGQKYVEAMRDRLLGPIMRANQIGHWLAASELEMPVSQADWMKLSEPWAKVYANEVATQSWDQTAEAVQQSVVHYVNSGLRGPALGDRLKDIFGLDPRSAKTWIAYSSRKDRPTTVPLTDKAAMLVAQRGKTIGDVQTFTAINFGRQLMYLQAIQDGKLPKDARKVWVTALDERVCEICRPMDGRAVSIIEGFQIVLPKPKTGRGKVRKSLDILVPPVHPNCRCTTVPEVIYRQGLITRRARFADSGSPAHRSRLRSDWRDLIEEVSVGKRLPWQEDKHKRDDKGKFAVQAGAALTVTALVAGGSMLAFHGSQLTFEGAKGVANFDDLNGLVKYHKIKSSFGICKGLNRPKTAQYEFIHPDVWANLSGKTHDETINNLMKVTRGREVEHGFFINPDGKILAGFRGDADSVSTIMPEGISAEERSTLTFFHNHPKQFPTEQHSPLSDADLKVFGRVGLNRMIAADDRGHVYEVRAGGKWQFYQHWLAGATSGTQNATMHAVNQFGGKAEAQQRSMHQEMLVRRYLLGQKYGYTPAGQPYVSKAFNPAQARNALGEFARMRGTQTAAAGGGGALLGAEAYSLTQQRHRTAQGQRASQVRARAYPKIKGISDASFGTPITKDTHPEGTYHLSTDQLLAYRSKPSLHTPTNQQDLKNKIARYGFNRPVHMKVYDNGAELWDGNHRLNIADDLDLKTVPVKVEHYDGTRPKEATVLELMNRFKQERYRKYLARERQARSGKAD